MFINNFVGPNTVIAQQRCCKVHSEEGEVSFSLRGSGIVSCRRQALYWALKEREDFF